LSKLKIRGTFYCQGTMVEEFPLLVRELSVRHLIGSHGYNHENYGGQRLSSYWTPDQPEPLKTKEEKLSLINKCREIHQRVIGYAPQVFVAPFNSIDYDLLDILDNSEFKVDSSFNNYRLGLATAFFRPQSFNIYELPLSVLRFAEYGYKNVLQGLTLDYDKITEVLRQEIVLITCHPYEFIEIKVPHPAHVLIVGKKKIETLKKLIRDLLNAGYAFVDALQLLERK
ncbi:MAG: polysaccharide deacetylase family protein, partial [Candidatus Omnitrophota bacterium]